ncbi:hypothetical protein FACS1894163_03270 [Spirochaetia bacterium]|nr:hypothetical protein FACS1894163_03270 [Spirochaetia bacterium]
MNKNEKDRVILRELAARVGEIAALPAQEEKRRLWRKLNGLKPERPMVTIDQVCWSEMNIDGKLTLKCEDKECRVYEETLRRLLLQWEYFPVDMVAEPFIKVYKAVRNTAFGMSVKEHTLATFESNEVLSHKFENQFNSVEDVMTKIKMPVVSHDTAETKRRMDFASWLFDGVMPLREEGSETYLSIWDPIAMWMSVEGALYGIVDKPDMMHALAKRIADGYMIMLDQMEEQGLLCHSQALVHCTGAWTDELPASGFNSAKPRTKDIWMFGLAQMFATVSPAMFEEYEIDYMMPIFERFGLVYYGCCDPLDGKMKEVRRIPHLRKISMSPWANKERGAEEIGKDYVFSNKPNPAYIAVQSFDGETVKKDLETTKEICRRYGCPLEFIFKDISTVYKEPERLKKWADIAMAVAEAG